MKTQELKLGVTSRFHFPSAREELYKLQLAEAKRKAKAQALAQFQISEAPIQSIREMQIAQQQSQARQRKFIPMVQKAEELEIWACSLNEVPLLRRMEAERMRLTEPKNAILRAESSARRVCTPDNKLNSLKHKLDVLRLPD